MKKTIGDLACHRFETCNEDDMPGDINDSYESYAERKLTHKFEVSMPDDPPDLWGGIDKKSGCVLMFDSAGNAYSFNPFELNAACKWFNGLAVEEFENA